MNDLTGRKLHIRHRFIRRWTFHNSIILIRGRTVLVKQGRLCLAHLVEQAFISLKDNSESLQRIKVPVYVVYWESLTARMRPSVSNCLHLFNKVACLRRQLQFR